MTAPGADEIQRWLVARTAEVCGLDSREVPVREPLNRLGISSLQATGIISELAAYLERSLSPTLIWAFPTIAELSAHLSGASGADTPGERRSDRGTAPVSAGPIAIIGMAGRFPGAPDIAAFWRLLRDGVDAVVEVPGARWNADAFYDADPDAPGKMITRRAAFLDAVDQFEPGFFDVSPREAREMDPQQRLALELVWEALEHAGVPPRALRGSRTGVFFGVLWHDYGDLARNALHTMSSHRATGQALNMVANRVSYIFGLRGPSLIVDTACSSSLVAVHLACQSLLQGDATMAVAGGVNLMLAPDTAVALSKFGGLAPDGRSKAFDARADGFGRGEGGGALVLKPLWRAMADGDPICAVIRATAVNNDGLSNGLTAPSPRAQEEVLYRAWTRAGMAGREAHYVEAHGTGTRLGDPIEVGALGAVLGRERPAEQPLYIGSVKSNIGHLEGAAGVAGLIKTALAIQHRQIPASLHFEEPNPHIPFDELRIAVARKLAPWPASADAPATAGVSSFGWGGTNAHAVLEGPPLSLQWIGVEAAGEDALAARVRALLAQADPARDGATPDADLARVAAELERDAALAGGGYRLAVTARTRAELSAQLAAFSRGETPPGLVFGAVPEGRPRVVFVCAPHGSQWQGMARQMMREPAFRAALFACDREMARYTGWSLVDELFADESRLDDASVVQPLLFALEVALAAQWRAWGVEPDVVVGHSVGEIAAAHIAGILELEDAVQVVYHYSRLLKTIGGHAGIALVELPADELTALVQAHGEAIAISGYNSRRSTLVAGEVASLRALMAALEKRAVRCALVHIDVAVHCSHVDGILDELREVLRGIRPRRAWTPMLSTVTGELVAGPEVDGAYFARNLREPVRFAGAVERLLGQGYDVFLELSPRPVLLHDIGASAAAAGCPALILPSLRRGRDDHATMFESRSRLFVRGAVRPAPAAPALVPLSARSPEALRARAAATAAWIAEHPELGVDDIVYTASMRRSHLEHRVAVVGRSCQELAARLEAFAGEGRGDDPGVAWGEVPPDGAPPPVFVFSGQGSQWAGMGRALLEQEPVFGAVIEDCDAIIEARAGWSLRAVLDGGSGASLHHTEIAQPALFAVQVALAALWRSWGVEPAAVIGHSVGEIAAAHVAGALALDDAVRLVCLRGRLMQAATGRGKMAAVALGAEEASSALRAHGDALALAAINDPESVVVSGDAEALDALCERLGRDGVRCRPLDVRYAFHSPQMEPFREGLVRELGDLAAAATVRPMYSTVTGSELAGPELDAAYWGRNLRDPVELARAVGCAVEAGYRTFVEVGPHPVLRLHVQRCLAAREHGGLVLGSLRRGQDGRQCLLQAAGALYAAGHDLAWERVHGRGGRVVALPAYPWQRRRYWRDAETQAVDHGSAGPSHPVLGHRLPGFAHLPDVHVWERGLDESFVETACDRIHGVPALALAGSAQLAAAAFAEVMGAGPGEIELAQVEAVYVDEGEDGRLQVVLTRRDAGSATAEVFYRSAGDDSGPADRSGWRAIARGTLTAARSAPRTDAAQWLRRACEEVSAQARRSGPPAQWSAMSVARFAVIDDRADGEVRVEIAAGEEAGADSLAGRRVVDARILGDGGRVLAEAHALELRAVAMSHLPRGARSAAIADWFYELRWIEPAQEAASADATPGQRYVILADRGGTGAALAAALQEAGEACALIAAAQGDEPIEPRVREALAAGPPAGTSCVVDMRALDRGADRDAAAAAQATCASVLRLVDTLAGAGASCRLWLVTRGAQPVTRERVAIEQAPVWGLGRVIALEHPEMWGGLIDLDPGPDAGEARRIAGLIRALGDEDQVALRDRLYVARLAPRELPEGAAEVPVRSDAAYLVTGGLGALGLRVARWLVERGARHLVLTSRSGADGARRDAVRALEALGATVHVAAVDVADREAMARVLADLPRPLAGVFHAAGVGPRQALVSPGSQAALDAAFRAKVAGTAVVDELTRDSELDVFVLFSSAAATWGGRGQGHYAAANQFLDAVAHQRRARGLPALSCNWGPWGHSGIAGVTGMGEGDLDTELRAIGLEPMAPELALAALERLLAAGVAQATVAAVHWPTFAAVYQTRGRRRLLDLIRVEAESPDGAASAELVARLHRAPAPKRRRMLGELVSAEVGRVLGYAPGERPPVKRGFFELGMDSLLASQLVAVLGNALGRRLPTTLALEQSTIAALADHLAALFTEDEAPAGDRAAREPVSQPPSEDEVSERELSEDELEARLAAKLAESL